MNMPVSWYIVPLVIKIIISRAWDMCSMHAHLCHALIFVVGALIFSCVLLSSSVGVIVYIIVALYIPIYVVVRVVVLYILPKGVTTLLHSAAAAAVAVAVAAAAVVAALCRCRCRCR